MTDFSAPQTYFIRNQYVILDSDLAELFDVKTKALNQQVTRNKAKFPDDFAFKLTPDEWKNLKSQNVTSTDEPRHGGRRTPPRAFSEEGVTMAATVLKSERATNASLFIAKVFVKARRNQLALSQGQNAPASITADDLARPNQSSLANKVNAVIERLLDSIIDPEKGTTVRKEAQDVLAESVSSLKAMLRNPQIKEEKALAEIALKIREAEKVTIETEAIDMETQHRQFALMVKQLRMVVSMEYYLQKNDPEAFLRILKDLSDD